MAGLNSHPANDQPSLPVGWIRATFAQITEPSVAQTKPQGTDRFSYVEISSVNYRTKRIAEPKSIVAAEAPSRARQRLQGGDVLISMTRPNLNAVAMVPASLHGAIGSTGFHVLRSIGVEPAWLFYLVQTTEFVKHMALLVQGALYPAVRPKDIESVPIPLAPLAEQRRIVAEIEKQLTRLDAAVASLERVQVELKQYRASVLKAGCEGRLVLTEAELARAEGRSYETGERLLARILKKRSEQREANRLGRTTAGSRHGTATGRKAGYSEPTVTNRKSLPAIPGGWTWAILAQIADLQGGITKGQKRHASERVRKVPYLRVANVQRGFLDLSEVKQIEATEDEISQLRLLRGDVLFNEGGDRDKLGRGWVWGDEIGECIHQNHVFRARLFLGDTQPKFISWFGNSLGQRYFLGEGKQTTNLASINLTKLSALPVPLPPADEQHRIVAEIESRFSFVASVEAIVELNLKRANRLRQAILKHAFEGRLVPQDPSEEPANILLERVRAARDAAESTKRGKPPRNRRTASAAESVS